MSGRLRGAGVSFVIVGLAIVLLLVHLPHGLYVFGVLLVVALAVPSRVRGWRDAWRKRVGP